MVYSSNLPSIEWIQFLNPRRLAEVVSSFSSLIHLVEADLVSFSGHTHLLRSSSLKGGRL